jgi:thiamine biosynthesis lipoprotein
MGTEFVITAYDTDPQRVELATSTAFQRIRELDQALSNFRSDSELSRLSATSPHLVPVPVSDDLWQVLQAADQVSRLSGGALDVTVGPYTKLWRRVRRTGELPDPGRLSAARAAVGYQHVQLHSATQAIRLTRPQMLLDLGAIAKGYALDQALARMRDHGVQRVLINGGGGVIAGQPPPGESGWRVGIAGLSADEPIRIWLSLSDRAVATSGDMWQFIEIDGVRYSHIIDPKTGLALTQRGSATVIAPSGTLSDAWATALSVMGPEQGLAALARQGPLEARIASLSGEDVLVRQTPGFHSYLEKASELAR